MIGHDIAGRDISDFLDKQFLGVIEDVLDPRKEGRARIRVVGVYDDIPTEDLPWAYPRQNSSFFGAAGKAGAISIPKKGAIVAIRFNNGNPYSPEYSAIHELADDVKEQLSGDGEYEGAHVVLWDGDKELKIFFSPTAGFTIQVKAASINISNDNIITVKTDTKVVVDSPAIELGAEATEAVIKGDTFQKLFNAHTHIGNLGAPTGIPIIQLNGSELSQVTKTK